MNATRRFLLGTGTLADLTGGLAWSTADSASAVTGPAVLVEERTQPLPVGMIFATLRSGRGMNLGIRDGDRILDAAAAEARFKTGAPTTIEAVLHGRGDVSALSKLLARARSGSDAKTLFIESSAAKFGPCVTKPEKILCIGLNYRAHAAEADAKLPSVPIQFNKYNSALNYHGGEIAVSKEKVARKFDYEGELVIIMGRTARDVSEADALSYVFGYCTGHDFSARDLQMESTQWMAGKGVILGLPKERQVWLKAGDQITTSIEKLGDLRFTLT